MSDDGVPSVSDGLPDIGRRIPRRVFLGGMAGTSALAAVWPSRFWQSGVRRAVLTSAVTTNSTDLPFPDLVIAVEREADLVLLDFAFYGFEVVPHSVDTGAPPTIVPTTSTNTIVVQFPPQALGEGVYLWQQDVLNVDPPPILSALSGPSQLCFTLAPGQRIPLPTMTVEDLLDWGGWGLVVPQNARFTGFTSTYVDPVPPANFETSIEFPNGLFLAPVVGAGSQPQAAFGTEFVSPSQPLVSSHGVVDLWSTTLRSTSNQTGMPITPAVAAVWAIDYPTAVPDVTPETYIDYVVPVT